MIQIHPHWRHLNATAFRDESIGDVPIKTQITDQGVLLVNVM